MTDAEKAFNFWKEREREATSGSPADSNPPSTGSDGSPRPRRPPVSYHVAPLTTEKPLLGKRGREEGLVGAALDDSELFRPSMRPRSSQLKGSSVSQLAEKLNLVLSPPPSPAVRSSEETPPHLHGRSQSEKALKDGGRSQAPKDSSAGEDESQGRRKSDNESFSRWRSLSGSRSKSTSVKIRSSGFTCYLDGPEEEIKPSHLQKANSIDSFPAKTEYSSRKHPPLKVSQSTPTMVPPLLPRSMSELLKTSSGPPREYLVEWPPDSEEVVAFWEMVQRISSQYCPLADEDLSSPTISEPPQVKPAASSKRRRNTVSLTKGGLVTVALETRQDVPPFVFQCDADCTVQEVIRRGLGKSGRGRGYKSCDQYILKVCGRDEYLDSHCLLSDYEYVYQCLKFLLEVRLVLVEKSSMSHGFPRKSHDGGVAPPPPEAVGVSRQELDNILDSYFAKEEHFRLALTSQHGMHSPLSLTTLAQSVISCVRLVCERLSFVEPPEVTEAIFNMRRACKTATHFDFETVMTIHEDSQLDGWMKVEGETENDEESTKDILSSLDLLHSAIQSLVTLYCSAFRLGYLPRWCTGGGEEREDVRIHEKPLRIKVIALHRVPQHDFRSYDMFQLEVCVYYGGKALSKRVYSPHAKMTRNFFTTVVWNKWLNLGIPLSHLPREARVCFTLHGLRLPGSGYQWTRHPIAWVASQLFSLHGALVSGPRLLGLWLGEGADPLDSTYSSLHIRKSILLQIAFEEHECSLSLPKPQPDSRPLGLKLPYQEPKTNVLHALKTIAQKDRHSSLSSEEQRLVWQNRAICSTHLSTYPGGLPAVLLSTPHWHSDSLVEVWGVLEAWPCRDPTFGLELLHPQFADVHVRSKAVEWLSQLPNDDLCDFLPQLVQTLRYDCYETSSMAELLLSRAASSPLIAHHLYWHLRLLCSDVRFSQLYRRLLSALEGLCGEVWRVEFTNQVELVEQLCTVAAEVKASRDAHRQTTLVHELKRLSEKFVAYFRLPLNPALQVSGIDIESCSFFNSNTVPLKIAFKNTDPFGSPIPVIFKIGDDLRQDILVLQLLRLMEKIWLRAGLDLKMVTYRCVATGQDQGMLEMVTGAETLRAIQTQHGLTGSFKDKPLSEWLRRHNPTDSGYTQAVENFTHSCAGYCVATYVLGICDRHNDNIMVKRSGHMFHIDYSRILGNAQMFGNIRRDRTPFVLTRDMAYVINDGDNSRFRRFVELCCAAYNELRKHSSLFISLLSLMLSSGMPQLSSADDIQYVRDALLPGLTENEAIYAFTKHIETSLGSMATQINFFIHNLAQLKFTSGGQAPGLLSISPNSFSIATDGKIHSARISTFHKRFYPETYYVYEIEVTRADPSLAKSTIIRRYREFDELHTKLLQSFPSDDLPQPPGKIYIPGRSHTKQTSEKRQVELNTYLEALLDMDPRISESDIVYTFLHCLPRDEQDLLMIEEEEGRSIVVRSGGRLKVELTFNQSEETLCVVIRHAKDLVPRDGVESADPYVKLYVLPDPDKVTKRKTKIAQRTLSPTYNETFICSVPKLELAKRTLQLSVWDASSLFSNQCLAVVAIELGSLTSDLITGVTGWYDLIQSPSSR